MRRRGADDVLIESNLTAFTSNDPALTLTSEESSAVDPDVPVKVSASSRVVPVEVISRNAPDSTFTPIDATVRLALLETVSAYPVCDVKDTTVSDADTPLTLTLFSSSNDPAML